MAYWFPVTKYLNMFSIFGNRLLCRQHLFTFEILKLAKVVSYFLLHFRLSVKFVDVREKTSNVSSVSQFNI